MDWSRNKNPVVNFVNLGRLYSLSQTGKFLRDSKLPFSRQLGEPSWLLYGGLNLGSLYNRTQPYEYLEPRGWAYFEDGSVFFPRETYNHHELQQVMKILYPYVRNPSDKKRVLQTTRNDDRQTRMVLLEKRYIQLGKGAQYLHIFGRYSHAWENLCAPSTPYLSLCFLLDPTRTSATSVTSTDRNPGSTTLPTMKFMSIENTVRSSSTFRGTLIKGVLQPNVRLGNGLAFTVAGARTLQKATSHPNVKEGEQTDTVPQSYSSQDHLGPGQEQETPFLHAGTAENEATFAQREAALHQDENAQHIEERDLEAIPLHERIFFKLKRRPAKANAHTKLQPTPGRKKTKRPPQSAWQVNQRSRSNTFPQPPPTKRPKDFLGERRKRTHRQERKAASAESIVDFLNHDDIMPTDALEMLRKAQPKR